MEEHVEMEQDSTSNVVMFVAGGTFIPGTTDNTVTEDRNSTNLHRTTVSVRRKTKT
jgi:hypothetical protein